MSRLLAVLFLLAAGSADANVMRAFCTPVGDGDVRCSVRGDPRWAEVFYIDLRTVPAGNGEGRVTVQTWRATCGMAGTMAASVRMGNRDSQRVARVKSDFEPNPAARPHVPTSMCVDVLIRNCTLNNRRASCDQVIYPWTSSITLSH
jgi:hypothetical protein